MPVIANPILPPPEPEEGPYYVFHPGDDIETTTDDYRFSGYRFVRDKDGNILMPYRPVTQPAVFSRRATSLGSFRVANP